MRRISYEARAHLAAVRRRITFKQSQIHQFSVEIYAQKVASAAANDAGCDRNDSHLTQLLLLLLCMSLHPETHFKVSLCVANSTIRVKSALMWFGTGSAPPQTQARVELAPPRVTNSQSHHQLSTGMFHSACLRSQGRVLFAALLEDRQSALLATCSSPKLKTRSACRMLKFFYSSRTFPGRLHRASMLVALSLSTSHLLRGRTFVQERDFRESNTSTSSTSADRRISTSTRYSQLFVEVSASPARCCHHTSSVPVPLY
jgi:hypothetical protein